MAFSLPCRSHDNSRGDASTEILPSKFWGLVRDLRDIWDGTYGLLGSFYCSDAEELSILDWPPASSAHSR